MVNRATSLPSCLQASAQPSVVLTRLEEEVHVAKAAVPRVTSAIFDIELDPSALKQQTANSQRYGILDRCLSDIDVSQSQLYSIPFGPQLRLHELCRPADSYGRQLVLLVEKIWCSGGSYESVEVPAAGVAMEYLASELLAAGWLVQIRQGATERRDLRSSLRCLKNQFLVCVGFQAAAEMWHTHSCGQHHAASASAPDDAHVQACHAAAFQGPCYLEEPLVIEPRFREQFLLANPTQAYSSIMQVVPGCFVGALPRLDHAVAMLSAEVLSNFQSQGMPLPPWRTREAIMSKWCPKQLEDLARMLRSMAAAAKVSGRGDVPLIATQQLLRDAELDGHYRIVTPPAAAADPSKWLGGTMSGGGRMAGPIAMLAAPMLLESVSEQEVPPTLPAHAFQAVGHTGWHTCHSMPAKAHPMWQHSDDSALHAVKKAKSMLAAALRSPSPSHTLVGQAGGCFPPGSSVCATSGHPAQPWANFTTVRWGPNQRQGNRI